MEKYFGTIQIFSLFKLYNEVNKITMIFFLSKFLELFNYSKDSNLFQVKIGSGFSFFSGGGPDADHVILFILAPVKKDNYCLNQ